ncbi:hypothetical protein QJQ45_002495 [Haematococcus lacustris]|nr:hypothetical protein QJQ45_002495 [Haematococcus lacustris]
MEAGAAQEGSIAAEVLSKHGHSAQPESQQVVAVLHALEQVIVEEKLPPSPTSFFAAGMSVLERPDTRGSAQVVQAVCTLLGLVLPRVPNPVLRAKWVGASALITSVLKQHTAQAGVAKACIGVLAQLLAAMEPEASAWPSALPAVSALIAFCTDPRAKVRKRAQSGLVEVLAALQRAPLLPLVSEAVARAAVAVLPGPEAAARAAAAASNKARNSAEEAIAAAVASALHMIGALKELLPLMAGPAVKAVVDQLFPLYPLRQPLLSRHTTQALTSLCTSPSSHLAPSTLADILMVVINAGDAVWVRSDADAILSLTRLLEGGFIRLAQADPGLCAARLARAVHALVPQLSAEQDGVRFGTSQALRNLLRGCVTAEMVTAAVEAARTQAGGAKHQAAAPLQSVLVALTSGLGPQQHIGWDKALPVAAEAFQVLAEVHPQGSELAGPLLKAVGDILGGAEEAADQQAAAAPQGAAPLAVGAAASGAAVAAAQAALSAALRALGPATVLSILPLNIMENLQGAAGVEPRTWLLPMMRRSVAGAPLAYWSKTLMPLARVLATHSSTAAAAGNARLATSCHVLELQIWALLPAFVSWAPDLPTTYPTIAKELAGAFSAREDLRPYVCAALERMVLQARQVLLEGGRHPELVGPAPPLGLLAEAGAGDDDEEEAGRPAPSLALQSTFRSSRPSHSSHAASHSSHADAGEQHRQPPAQFTEEHAAACVAAVRGLSKNWLSLLCKAFLAAEPHQRGSLARTISAVAVISGQAITGSFFKTVVTRLVKVMDDAAKEVPPPDIITDGGSDVVSRRCAFTELALALATGLEDASLGTLLKVAKPSLLDTKEAALQKKGYKVLSYLVCSRPTFLRTHLGEVLSLVVGGATCSLSAAKRYRLRCLQPLILLLSGKEPLPPGCLPSLPLAAPSPTSDTPGAKGPSKGSKAAGGKAAAAAAKGRSSSSDEEGMEGDEEGDEEGASSRAAGGKDVQQTGDAARQQLVSMLVAELMLCCKESNMKTRMAAYELLVAVAHAMDDMDPLQQNEQQQGDEAAMNVDADPALLPKGGLITLFTMVMAGLAGQTPHMISASIMALARLLYEFAPQLQPLVPQLLPPVLSLLRSRSREVVKAVLGFVKVCAMRMPVPMLTVHLAAILEGALLWAADSKNKFKLKVRVIVERLARRCGFQAVAEHIPASDTRLLTHIRKEASKKQRNRAAASQAGDEDEDEGDDDDAELTGGRRGGSKSAADARSQRSGPAGTKSGVARTARASEWGRTTIFSEGGEDEEGGGDGDGASRHGGARSVRGIGAVRGAKSSKSEKPGAASRGGPRLQEGADGDDPMDLLDPAASRHLTRSAAGVRSTSRTSEPAAQYTRGPDGRLIINDEDAVELEAAMKRKRKKRGEEEEFASDESDMEDLKNYAGLGAAMKAAAKSTAYQKALSVKSGVARSTGDRYVGAKSAGGRSSTGKSVGGASRGSAHSGRRGPSLHGGDRFKSKAGTGGDVKGRSKTEPYAYWQFDRKMLNRRPSKKREANASLSGLVKAAQAGAAKGAKAKVQRVAKRARRA